MESKELRVGNLVEFMEDATVFEVTSIESDGLGVKNDSEETWISIDQFCGIDLTEQHLIDFGFEKSGLYWFIGDVYIYIDKVEAFEFIYQFNYSFIGITSVHQLQNLYFALTGKELILKP